MEWFALGDSAWLSVARGDSPLARLAEVLNLLQQLQATRIPEVAGLVSSFDSLAVHCNPRDGERVLQWLTQETDTPRSPSSPLPEPRLIEIPVCYGGEPGPDLARVAAAAGKSAKEVVALHCAAEYTVAAIGFSPGFPYLLGLPDALQVPRRATPRRVAAGSVAIAGTQAGIYPCASQGGWHVLGRTHLSLFDPETKPPSRLRVGDRVRFRPMAELRRPRQAPPIPALPEGTVELLKPGAFTTIQDLGRPGCQDQGVSPGGAADPVSAMVANRLVGNPDGAAVLECCLSGPILKFHAAARIAWVGWENHQRSGRPVELAAGERVDLRGPLRAVRGYVAFAGGIELPAILGSRATDVRAGWGGFHGRALRAGDRLALGMAKDGPSPRNWWVRFPHLEPPRQLLELRCLPGVQAASFDAATQRQFRDTVFRVSTVSDRMGVRLEGSNLGPCAAGSMVSQPVVAGSVQVLPSGMPIVLLAERQTIGGYPQIAHVISADLPKLARAWPGTPVRFREVSLPEAREAWANLQRQLALLNTRLSLAS